LWFLASVAMLLIGVLAFISGGSSASGMFTPANIALVAAILSLLVLPTERSVRR